MQPSVVRGEVRWIGICEWSAFLQNSRGKLCKESTACFACLKQMPPTRFRGEALRRNAYVMYCYLLC